jgi:hypothetical protein
MASSNAAVVHMHDLSRQVVSAMSGLPIPLFHVGLGVQAGAKKAPARMEDDDEDDEGGCLAFWSIGVVPPAATMPLLMLL